MHAHTIFVTSLHEMPHFVQAFSPTRVVSLIQPELMPQRPAGLSEHAYHRVNVHDISEQAEHHILAAPSHVEALITFIDGWDPAEGALLTHCYAGVSRSTAAALIAATMKTGDPGWSARRLRAASPHAMPNWRIVELADDVLGLSGALIEARSAMGEPGPDEAGLTVLRIGAEQRAP